MPSTFPRSNSVRAKSGCLCRYHRAAPPIAAKIAGVEQRSACVRESDEEDAHEDDRLVFPELVLLDDEQIRGDGNRTSVTRVATPTPADATVSKRRIRRHSKRARPSS